MRGQPTVEAPESKRSEERDSELRRLFHRLNNELAIILANAKLVEARARDDISTARAAQVIASVLDAMETAMKIRQDTTAQEITSVDGSAP